MALGSSSASPSPPRSPSSVSGLDVDADVHWLEREEKDAINITWRKYWCVVVNQCLCCFTEPDVTLPATLCLPLQGCSVQAPKAERARFAFRLNIVDRGSLGKQSSKHVFSTSTEGKQQQWISTIIANSKIPRKCGMLYKEGHLIRNWHERYFALSMGILSYYNNPTDVHPIGLIDISGCCIGAPKKPRSKYPYAIRINAKKGDSRGDEEITHTKLIIAAKTEADLELWRQAIIQESEVYAKFVQAQAKFIENALISGVDKEKGDAFEVYDADYEAPPIPDIPISSRTTTLETLFTF